MRALRLIGIGWLYQFKQLSRSSFDSFLAILRPIFFATVAFFMFPIALVILVSSFSCTGLGLICAAGLRLRETAVLNNIIFGLLLIFTGANVPLDELPGWMQWISNRMPLTHGIEAARDLADGASLGDVSGLKATEFTIGVVYTIVGYQALRFMERSSRKRASIQIA